MELIIENLAKINSVRLALNGLTIIAGANNTGKTTLGKALWAIITSYSNLEEKVRAARIRKYQSVLRTFDCDTLDCDGEFDSHQLAEDFASGNCRSEGIRDNLTKECMRLNKPTVAVERCVAELESVRALDKDELKRQEILNVFERVFSQQANSFIRRGTKPFVSLKTEGGDFSVMLTSALPDCRQNVSFAHKACYIDSSDALDRIGDGLGPHRVFRSAGSYLENILYRDIMKGFLSSSDEDGNVVDDLLARKRFSTIEDRLKELMGGTLELKQGKGVVFIDKLFPGDPLRLSNLSQGVKSMALLQAAFMNGVIGDNDVLILDEPEVHLHPDWQIRYAEFIVLLQKEFKLTVLISSHSPDFVQAIRLYARKYDVYDGVNCYLSVVGKDGSIGLRTIGRSEWDLVFETFAGSFDKLQSLRQELNFEGGEEDS